jgi:hypothetical protein
MRLVPSTAGGADRYLARQISGFPSGGVIVMPTAGPLETDSTAFASDFDRHFEVVSPYYGSDILDRYGITVEYTAARRAAMYRLTYAGNSATHVLLMAADIAQDGPSAVSGSSGGAGRASISMRFSRSRIPRPGLFEQAARSQGAAVAAAEREPRWRGWPLISR